VEAAGAHDYVLEECRRPAVIGKTPLRAVLAAALLLPVPGYAGVKIRFINPERYSNAGSFGAGGREATLAAFRTYFEKLGTRFLTPGQNLTIDVLNIDLAGEYEPWRRNLSDVRIMRDVTPPRVKLSYVLNEKGKRTRSGEDNLTHINYQMNPSARFSSDHYAYDKALLEDWFRRIAGRNRL
jgi:hypothetical protein